MKIYLDDERPTPDGWVRAWTAAQAIHLLDMHANEVEVISLDHDLGDDSAGTGYDVLGWIEYEVMEGMYTPPKDIRVHTANPPARVRMLAAIAQIERLVSAKR